MNKLYSMLGIGRRAGYLVSGDTGCEVSIKTNKCYLLIIAEDASNNTKDKYISLCKRKGVKYVLFGDKGSLGKAIGKGEVATISITNRQFADTILIKGSNSITFK